MTATCRLSILIPAYNHAAYIGELLESLWREAVTDCEIILIDDGSPDDTFDVALRLAARSPVPMQVTTRPNRGLNATLNELIDLATGTWLYIIASDDRVVPGALERLLALGAADTSLRAIYANGRSFGAGGEAMTPIYPTKVLTALSSGKAAMEAYLHSNVSIILTQASLFRTDFVRALGGFDASALLDDWPFHIKVFGALRSDAEWCFCDIELLHYRRHASNSSRDIGRQYRQITDTVRRFVPPPRQAALLARAYADMAPISLLKRPLTGLSLVLESQRLEWRPRRLLSLPLAVMRTALAGLRNRLSRG